MFGSRHRIGLKQQNPLEVAPLMNYSIITKMEGSVRKVMLLEWMYKTNMMKQFWQKNGGIFEQAMQKL